MTNSRKHQTRRGENEVKKRPLEIELLGMSASVPTEILSSKTATNNIIKIIAIIFLLHFLFHFLTNSSPSQIIKVVQLIVDILKQLG